MNIRDAKIQISNALRSYFEKDEYGEYIIPTERQRPVFLMGPPGVGKTAIMEQIAAELGVGLLSYAMTQHTIQTVLGQAYVTKKTYKGVDYDITEYTMSEIIASVFELIEETGAEEGILFLDELNCVNDTLAPILLQFLQYKMVGRHVVPNGWLIVGAGNPVEYNSNAHDFDIVTWDRLKRIDVDPDLDIWKEYAFHKNLHQSIISYLNIQPLHFYRIEKELLQMVFITGRSWDDLSEIMKLYDRLGIPIDQKLISQYIQIPQICDNFTGFYNLYNQCQEIFNIPDIVDGYTTDELLEIISHADEHEKVCFRGLLCSALSELASRAMENTQILNEIGEFVESFKENLGENSKPFDKYNSILNEMDVKNEAARKSGSKSKEKATITKTTIRVLKQNRKVLKNNQKGSPVEAVQSIYDEYAESLKNVIDNEISLKFNNVLAVYNQLYEINDDMEKFIKELEFNDHIMDYISIYGCTMYEQIKSSIQKKHEVLAAAPAPEPVKIEPKHKQLYTDENDPDNFVGFLNKEEKKSASW